MTGNVNLQNILYQFNGVPYKETMKMAIKMVRKHDTQS